MPFEFQLGFPEAVFLEHALVRRDDQHAARAIDDQKLVFLDQGTGMMQADHRGNGQAPGDDGGVRGGAAQIGDEAADLELLELDGVGRRKIVGDDDQVPVADAPGGLALMSEQDFEHPLDHLDDVVLALAQVGILDLVELRRDLLQLLHQRPLGIAAPLADQLARHFGEQGIAEDHRMHIDEGGEFRRRAERGAGLDPERAEFRAHRRHGAIEAGQLGLDVALLHQILRHLQRGMRDQAGMADGDARRNREAMDDEAHAAPSLTLGWAKASRAAGPPPRRGRVKHGAAARRRTAVTPAHGEGVGGKVVVLLIPLPRTCRRSGRVSPERLHRHARLRSR